MARRRGRPKRNNPSSSGNGLQTPGSAQGSVSTHDKSEKGMDIPDDVVPEKETNPNLEESEILDKTETPIQKSYASVVGNQEDDQKLCYIPATEVNGNFVAKLTKDDVIDTTTYWDATLVCCILGANPPLEVVKGFVNRIWSSYSIEEVSVLKEGQLIVSFKRVEDRDEVIKRKYYYFDNKPVLVQKWYPGVKVNIDQLDDIPIWIQLPDLEMKYWSLTGLSKIGSLVGKPVKRDRPTASKRKYAYARIQVEVKVQQEFPLMVQVIDDEDRVKSQEKGDKSLEVRRKLVWKPKRAEVNNDQAPEMENKKEMDKIPEPEEEFTVVTGKKAGKPKVMDMNEGNGIEALMKDRKGLWDHLERIANSMVAGWGIIGDFNSVLSLKDRIGGNNVTEEETKEFKECMITCGMEEIPSEGSYYTWSNKQGNGNRIYSRLDRALSNLEWIMKFDEKVQVIEEGISDHCLLLIRTYMQDRRNVGFKYCDMWELDNDFKPILQAVWNKDIPGWFMYQLIRKQKDLKHPLKQINKKFHHIHQQCELLREELSDIQSKLKGDINNTSLLDREKECLQELIFKNKASHMMRMQQAKQNWICEGDQGSKLFFAWTKKRTIFNQITSIITDKGEKVEGRSKVAEVMVDYFPKRQGHRTWTDPIQDVTGLEVNYSKSQMVLGGITDQEADGILREAKMERGTLPFRYLGGPITPSRISKRECEGLINKLTVKITSWATKHLSYAGRCKLINTVLMGVISFWCKLFVIPNKVMHKIQAICRNFLWGSSAEYKRISSVCWEENSIGKWIQFQWRAKTNEEMMVEVKKTKGRQQRQTAVAGFAAICYGIWHARNLKIKQNRIISPEECSAWIRDYVRVYINAKLKRMWLR
ncbi:unnamed protein product [Cuscuta campestris]|uniref:DUF4283 domain-containing protein n=1 Tax=Cuscuta campestris TaxID=132261 RepID=A0A484L7C3_9ASTE|nr:unnamed protein product [Cuscuta campestris]